MYNEVITPIDFTDDTQYGVRCLSHTPMEEVALFHILLNLNLVKKTEIVIRKKEENACVS